MSRARKCRSSQEDLDWWPRRWSSERAIGCREADRCYALDGWGIASCGVASKDKTQGRSPWHAEIEGIHPRTVSSQRECADTRE